MRILYSFPHNLGAGRICYIAWNQVNGLAAAGAQVLAFPRAQARPVAAGVRVQPTLARGKYRIPYKALRRRTFALHDWIVARRLAKLAGQVDLVHLWPQGALRTIAIARRLGIPAVLERPNAHTRYAYESVREECERLGVQLPPSHHHAFNEEVLRLEEEEFRLADYLLCPSDFVVKTFLHRGFPPQKLLRHQYGYDQKLYFPNAKPRDPEGGLKVLFAGECAPRKGLHLALEAWLKSPAHIRGTFRIAGAFVPGYAERLSAMLADPSVHVLGHRNDMPDLMRESDVLILPSIEEGYGLVVAEAMGSGCVPLTSDACTEICRHMETGLVHHVGDVDTLTRQITLLHEDPALLGRLRAESLRRAPEFTWAAAGEKLLEAYQQALAGKSAPPATGVCLAAASRPS